MVVVHIKTVNSLLQKNPIFMLMDVSVAVGIEFHL